MVKDMPYSPYLYFVSRVRLSIIGHRIRSSLYSSSLPNGAWSRVQQGIRKYDREITQWAADLPADLNMHQGIDVESSDRQGGQLLNQFELAMSYQSTRMILFRPSLCHMEGVIAHESTLSQSFNQEAALSCISAARSLLALLPDNVATSHASKCLPCWSLLHYITQAGAVIILELCLKAEHMPGQAEQLSRDLVKVVEWLAEMAADSLSAWRSWKICRKLALQAAAGVGIEIVLPEDVQQPPGSQPPYAQLLSQTLNVPLDQIADMDMLDHVQQQVEVPFTTTSTLFPTDAEMADGSWHVPPTTRDSAGNLTYSERQMYPLSTGEPVGKMDWRP